MRLNRIMIAAPKSGSGKTTVTCAVLQILKDMGHQVVSYKCGPDYIDPMFHKTVLGIPSKNLDTFFTGEEQTRELFLKDRSEDEFAVLEGVMGLYDGLGGVREEGSSYHLAKVTKTPVILVVDAKGMGRSVIAMIAGFLAYDTDHLIKGVILNRMSKGYYDSVKSLIESELKLSVVGYFPENKKVHLGSRHLGLQIPEELPEIRETLSYTAAELRRTVDIGCLVKIADGADEIMPCSALHDTSAASCRSADKKPVIAVARDEAFCFYYEDNLHMLEEYGAELQYFSPIHDHSLPKNCSGILLGGGYPELYAKELSNNLSMRECIRNVLVHGMPVVAECGGFMYLHSAIIDQNGASHEMVGFLPGSCHDTGKLVRFGYIEVKDITGYFLPAGEKIRCHEFHYYDSTDNGDGCLAVKPTTGKSYPCIAAGKTYWMGFPHLYYPSNPEFVRSFVEMTRSHIDE